MVGIALMPLTGADPSPASRWSPLTAGRLRSRHLRHRRLRARVTPRRSLVATLVRLDDDPVLLCDCAESATHTCS